MFSCPPRGVGAEDSRVKALEDWRPPYSVYAVIDCSQAGYGGRGIAVSQVLGRHPRMPIWRIVPPNTHVRQSRPLCVALHCLRRHQCGALRSLIDLQIGIELEDVIVGQLSLLLRTEVVPLEEATDGMGKGHVPVGII